MVSRDGSGTEACKTMWGILLISKFQNFITTEIQTGLLFFGRLIRPLKKFLHLVMEMLQWIFGLEIILLKTSIR
jgi:hypothetical protein